MYAFRRIKIEVNIGSTTIVSLDPFPFPRIDLPFSSPVLCTMKPRSIDEPNVRTWGRYYLSVMMARVHESMKRETKEGGNRGDGRRTQPGERNWTETDHRIIVAFTLGQTRSIVMDKLLIEEKMVSNFPSPFFPLFFSLFLPAPLANGNILTSSHEESRLVHL